MVEVELDRMKRMHVYIRLSQKSIPKGVGRALLILCVAWAIAGVCVGVAPGIGWGRVHAQASPSAGDATAAQQPAYTLPPDELAKAEALERIRTTLSFGDGIWGLVALWALLATGVAAGIEARGERVSKRRWVQGLFFFAVLIVVLTLTELPVGMYAHAVSRSYGISVQGWGSWFGDQAKALGLSLVLGAPVLLFFHWIVRVSPRRYWLWGWIAGVALMLAGAFVEPLFEPLFNQYEPLEKTNPALVAKLEKVVARTGTRIPPERMYLMKASVKTNAFNAYVSGLGATKRVVVWDTTAGRMPDDEILFIFGHESGHYVLKHIPKQMALGAVGLFVLFWICARSGGWIAGRFGARWRLLGRAEGGYLASRAGFVVLLFVFSMASFVTEPLANAVSRHFEHEADVYGQEAIHGLVPDPQKTAVAAFNALGEAALDDPFPNAFVVFWTYSHPSIQQRATFAEHYNPWANGGRGRFFKK